MRIKEKDVITMLQHMITDSVETNEKSGVVMKEIEATVGCGALQR